MAMFKPGVMTKFVGATNSKGSHIKATQLSTGASMKFPYDHALSSTANHERAAETMLQSKNLVACQTYKNEHIFIKK